MVLLEHGLPGDEEVESEKMQADKGKLTLPVNKVEYTQKGD